jgi:sensory rhodopsin
MGFNLVMATQFSFMVAFVGMMGGALYFALAKSSLPPEHQSTAATSSVYCFVAAVIYGYMNFQYGIGTDALASGRYPTELRYIDWIITTPLIVYKFPELLQDERAGPIALIVIVADFIMIMTGFAGETSINAARGATVLGWSMFGVSMLAWLFIVFILYSAVTDAAKDKLEPIQVALSRLKLFIVFGWAIYPLGYLITLIAPSPEVRVARELIYNFADLFNKVGFGMVAVYAINQVAREARMRDLMRQL